MEAGSRKPGLRAVTLVDVLHEHPFLSGLSERDVLKLARHALVVRFEPGQTIFEPGTPANRLYLIRSGEVRLDQPAAGSAAILAETLRSGDVICWSWLFPPFLWNCRATAVLPTEAICLYGSRIRDDCESDPAFGYSLMRRIVGLVARRLEAQQPHKAAAASACSPQPGATPGCGRNPKPA